MALGATQENILRNILLRGMAPVLAGLAFGVAASLFATRVLAGMLFGVTATDPSTFAAIAGLWRWWHSSAVRFLPAKRRRSILWNRCGLTEVHVWVPILRGYVRSMGGMGICSKITVILSGGRTRSRRTALQAPTVRATMILFSKSFYPNPHLNLSIWHSVCRYKRCTLAWCCERNLSVRIVLISEVT